MKIGGLIKFSMIDFPGKVAAILFTRGCNLRCAYCHNPELLEYNAALPDAISEEELNDFLIKRKGRLDGIVITGGEPTLQPDLAEFCAKLKKLGYQVKLDTNGTNPSVVENLLKQNLVDFIAMDIKAPFDKYEAVCQRPVDTEKVKQTMALLEEYKIPHQYRTTYYKTVLNDEDIAKIQALVDNKLVVQECLPVKQKDTLKVFK